MRLLAPLVSLALVAAATAQTPFAFDETVVTNENGSVYRVTRGGTVRFLASVGSFAGGVDFDVDGSVVCAGPGRLLRIDAAGTVTTVIASIPSKAYEVEVGPKGNYWITTIAGRTIQEYTRAGVVVRSIGYGEPMWGLGYDPSADRFFACGSQTLYTLDRSPQKTTTLAQTGSILQGAHFLGGTLYAGDDGTDALLGYDRQGNVTTIVSGAPLGDPGEGVDAFADGDLVITDDSTTGGNGLLAIERSTATITTLTLGGPLPNLNGCAVRPGLDLVLRGSAPRVGQRATIDVQSTGAAGEPYVLAASLSTISGFPLPGQRRFPLDPDGLFFVTAQNKLPAVFTGFQGTLDDAGRASAAIVVPPFPKLAGVALQVAGLVFHPLARGGIRLVDATPLPVTIQP